jgi:hypothetical protein
MKQQQQYGIQWTHYQWNLSFWLLLFLMNFLQNGHYHDHLGNVNSVVWKQETGVAQGSVLSMTLFIVAVYGMVSTVGLSV